MWFKPQQERAGSREPRADVPPLRPVTLGLVPILPARGPLSSQPGRSQFIPVLVLPMTLGGRVSVTPSLGLAM